MVVAAASRRFSGDGFVPAAFELHRAGRLAERVDAARAELRMCLACPRECGVDRIADEVGTCHVGRFARVASAFAHFGEEDCLRGRRGSGTIFFASCNLRCVFCQNWDISQAPSGRVCDAAGLADLMLQLQQAGCHNINLVTPEHVAPQVVEAIAVAVPAGLRLPIVYNTSAYDSLRSLALLDGLIDIYMPDFKFWRSATARRLARAADYPAVARAAIVEMHRQVGNLLLDREGIARRGLLVRHLVMPGQEGEATAIMQWLAETVSPDTYLNIMGQYRPAHRVPDSARYGDIDRRPTAADVAAVYRAAAAAGLWRFDQRWA